MKALLRKDAVWMTVLFALTAWVFFTLQSAQVADHIWFGMFDESYEGYTVGWAIAATVWGAWAALPERFEDTREYLLHRLVSARRVFWIRVTACLVLLFVAAAIPYLNSWFGTSLDTGNRALWEWTSVIPHIAMATLMVPMFALGFFALTTTGSKVSVLVQVAAMFICVGWAAYRLLFPLPFGDAWVASPWLYAAVQLGLGALILWLAMRNFTLGVDRDTPTVLGPQMGRSIFAVGALACICSMFATKRQLKLQDTIRAAYPSFVVLDDGTAGVARVRTVRIREPLSERVDDQAKRIRRSWSVRIAHWVHREGHPEPGPPVALDVNDHVCKFTHDTWFQARDRAWTTSIEDSWNRADYPGPDVDGPDVPKLCGTWRPLELVRSQSAYRVSRGYLHQPSGLFHLYRLRNAGGRAFRDVQEAAIPVSHDVFARGDQMPFGAETSVDSSFRFQSYPSSYSPALAFRLRDPRDRSVWKAEQVDRAINQAKLRAHTMELVAPPKPRAPSSAEEMYVDEAMERVFDSFRQSLPRNCEWYVTRKPGLSGDPLNVLATLHYTPRRIYFPHVFEPQGDHERALVHFGGIYAMLRAPLLEVASYASSIDDFPMFDPFLMGTPRVLPLAICLLFMWLCLRWARKRMKQFGVSRGRMTLWTVLIMLGGFGSFVAFLILETARAHRPVKLVNPASAPPLLLHSLVLSSRR